MTPDLAAVRARHTSTLLAYLSKEICAACSHWWPCDTAIALAELARVEGVLVEIADTADTCTCAVQQKGQFIDWRVTGRAECPVHRDGPGGEHGQE